MKIIGIKPQKGHLYAVDLGEKVLFLDRDTADENGLKAGDELDETTAEKLYHESQLRRAKSRCLWYLESRDYSARELAEKLYGKFEPEIIAEATERMKELGLINDETYARHRAEVLVGQGASKNMAKMKLMAKGIDRAVINDVLDSIEYDGVASAEELIRRKYFGKIGNPDDVRRTYQALLRRGYAHSDIKQALKRIKEDLDLDGEQV